MKSIAILIPCYNESKRLKKESILDLYYKTNADIFLVNDGSKDNTLALLQDIQQEFPDRIKVINHEVNYGKANTIFHAIILILSISYDYIGYFDADFSTPSFEIIRLINIAKNGNYNFVIGSRVSLFQTEINRKWYRHYIGRIIVSIINFKHHLGIYDTQCGAKLFSTNTLKSVLNQPFKTSWLFDVELMIKLKESGFMKNGLEVPLQKWTDVDGSKLSWKSVFKIIKEMFIIYSL